MNIGMILDKEFNGDMRVENEVYSLSKAGLNVYVFCFSFNGQYKEEDYFGATIINIPVSKKNTRKLRALTNTIFNFYPKYLVNLLKQFVVKHQIDVLHIHDLYLFEVGIKFKEMFPQLILVGDLHENYVEGLKHYKFANTFPGNLLISIPKWEKTEIDWCNKFNHLITVIDEAVFRYQSLGIEKNKISVVANYVNQESFLTTGDDEKIKVRLNNKYTVTYIGGFDIHRGLESVVKAVPKIIETVDNFQLILVGRGRNENDLKQLANDLNVFKYISFEGFQPPSTLPSYIKASSICLIPHLKTVHTDNTIPHKLFHYMLLEKPVVASNCTPLKRIIEESNSGLIYQSDNESEFAEKIIHIYKNPDLATKFGVSGKKAVLSKYNWEMTSKVLINLYQQIEKN